MVQTFLLQTFLYLLGIVLVLNILTSNVLSHLHITSVADLLVRSQIFLILVVPDFLLRPCTVDIDVSVPANLTL